MLSCNKTGEHHTLFWVDGARAGLRTQGLLAPRIACSHHIFACSKLGHPGPRSAPRSVGRVPCLRSTRLLHFHLEKSTKGDPCEANASQISDVAWRRLTSPTIENGSLARELSVACDDSLQLSWGSQEQPGAIGHNMGKHTSAE